MRSFTIIIFTFNSFILFSQKKVTAYHKEYCSEDITQKQCKQRALKNAKLEALRKAGVGETIQSTSTLSRNQNDEKFESYFSNDILINIGGAIKSWEYVLNPQKGYDEKINQFYFELSINAKIIKFKSKPDPQFEAQIEGIKGSYKSSTNNKDNFEFSVTTSIDCYMKIFYVNDSEAQILYPVRVAEHAEAIKNATNKLIKAKQPFKNIDYITPFSEKEKELGKLIFIFTKDEFFYPFSKANENGHYIRTSTDKIFEWYMKIEPENKIIKYEQFSISR